MKRIEDDALEVDIFELHDLGVIRPQAESDLEDVNEIKLLPHENLSEEQRQELEARYNKLLDEMRSFDCFLHDVAEFSC